MDFWYIARLSNKSNTKVRRQTRSSWIQILLAQCCLHISPPPFTTIFLARTGKAALDNSLWSLSSTPTPPHWFRQNAIPMVVHHQEKSYLQLWGYCNNSFPGEMPTSSTLASQGPNNKTKYDSTKAQHRDFTGFSYPAWLTGCFQEHRLTRSNHTRKSSPRMRAWRLPHIHVDRAPFC